jgi:hypothetical protein
MEIVATHLRQLLLSAATSLCGASAVVHRPWFKVLPVAQFDLQTPLPTRVFRAILCMRKSPFPIAAIGALK